MKISMSVASLLVLAACSSSSPSAPKPLFVNDKCADLVVVGLRGSGQSATKNHGVGAEVLKSVRAMATQLHKRADTTIKLEALPYIAALPATMADYLASVKGGERQLGSQLSRLEKSCPHSRFGLIGFSQGAEVTHAYAHNLAPARADRVVLIAMIADPLRNPADTITTWSYGKPLTRTANLRAGPRFNAQTGGAAITLCAPADEVCHRPSGASKDPLLLIHRTFYEEPSHVRSTGEQLDSVLRRNGVG